MGKSNIYIGIGLAIFGGVQLYEGQAAESVLYFALGLAFLITWISFQKDLRPNWKKLLTVLSWLLIAFSAFWFFYLVRTESFL